MRAFASSFAGSSLRKTSRSGSSAVRHDGENNTTSTSDILRHFAKTQNKLMKGHGWICMKLWDEGGKESLRQMSVGNKLYAGEEDLTPFEGFLPRLANVRIWLDWPRSLKAWQELKIFSGSRARDLNFSSLSPNATSWPVIWRHVGGVVSIWTLRGALWLFLSASIEKVQGWSRSLCARHGISSSLSRSSSSG